MPQAFIGMLRAGHPVAKPIIYTSNIKNCTLSFKTNLSKLYLKMITPKIKNR